MDTYEQALFEIDMITACNMIEGMDYETAEQEARKEYKELQKEL